MRRLIASTFASLDGIMQAPGGPEEDPTGGFALGGWMASFAGFPGTPLLPRAGSRSLIGSALPSATRAALGCDRRGDVAASSWDAAEYIRADVSWRLKVENDFRRTRR